MVDGSAGLALVLRCIFFHHHYHHDYIDDDDDDDANDDAKCHEMTNVNVNI